MADQQKPDERVYLWVVVGAIFLGLVLWWWWPPKPSPITGADRSGPTRHIPSESEVQHASAASTACAFGMPPIRLHVNVVIRSMQGLRQHGIPQDIAQHVDEITQVFRPAGIELSVAYQPLALNYSSDVTDDQVDKLFAENETASADPTVSLLILSRWQLHPQIAGELWSKRDRNQIAIFADAILDSHDDDKLRSIRRTIAHELVHAFGLHHMDWEGNSARDTSSIEGYSNLTTALWCLSTGSARYLTSAPLPFVTPGNSAVPFFIASYTHSGHFHADPHDPVDLVVAVPDEPTLYQINEYRAGLLPATATVANLNKKSANAGELTAVLEPDAPAFEQADDITFTLRMENHGDIPWYIPSQDDLQKPDTLLGGADKKVVWLVSPVSELKGAELIPPKGNLHYRVRMNPIAGYHGPESGIQLDTRRYAVNMVIPISAKIGEPAAEFVTASTEIRMKAADSGLGGTLWTDLNQRFGPQGRWCFNSFLRFGGCVGDKGMAEYLDGLLQQGLTGPQRSAICVALLQNAQRIPAAEPAQQRKMARWAACSIESATSVAGKDAVRNMWADQIGPLGSPKVGAASPAWLPHLLSDSVDQFAPGSSVIPDLAFDAISAEVEVLNGHPGAGILLVGRADSAGSHESNCLIGHRRAAAVRTSLRLLGIPDERIHTLSRGDFDPYKQGPREPDPDARARRVDLRYLATNPANIDDQVDCDVILKARGAEVARR